MDRTWATKAPFYRIFGIGAALAGIIQPSQVHTALATYGPLGTELNVIPALVLGGTGVMGGNGSITRTKLGTFFLGVINNGMNILNAPIDVQTHLQKHNHCPRLRFPSPITATALPDVERNNVNLADTR